MSGHINAVRIANMTPEELEAYVNSNPDIDQDEVTQALDDYRTQVEEQIEELNDGIRGRGRGRERLEGEQLEEAQRLVEDLENELEDIENASENFEEDFTAQATHRALENQDISAEASPTIGNANLPEEFDGGTYTIDMGSGMNGVSADIFGTADEGAEGSSEFRNYLEAQGILDEDGNLITPLHTVDDIETARTTWLATKRIVTVSFAPDIQIINVMPGTEDGSLILTLRDAEGREITLKLMGDAYIKFTGANFTADYYPVMREWSPALQERTLLATTEGDQLISEMLSEDQTDAEIRGLVAGYEEGQNGYNDVSQYLASTSLTPDQQDQFNEAYDKLFEAIANGGDIGEVWDEILPMDGYALQALIFAIAQNNSDQFHAIFDGHTAQLRTALIGNHTVEWNLPQPTKLAILLLETYAGGGAANLLETYFAHTGPDGVLVAGTWSGDEEENASTQNQAVLADFRTLSSRLTGGTPGNISAAIQNEADFKTQASDAADESAENQGLTDTQLTLTQAQATAMATQLGVNEDYYEDDGDWDDWSSLYNFIGLLATKHYDSISDLSLEITTWLGQFEGRQDDYAAALVVLLHDNAPELFEALKDTDFNDQIWALINNGDEWAGEDGSTETLAASYLGQTLPD